MKDSHIPTLLAAALAMLLALTLSGCVPDEAIAAIFPTAWKLAAGGVALLFARITIRSVFVRGLLMRLGQVADMIVLEVQQVYVEKVKLASADGKLTEAEAKEARLLALSKLKDYAFSRGVELLLYILGVSGSTLGDMRATAVEASVAKLKLAQGAARPR